MVKLQEIPGKIHRKFLNSVTPKTDWEALLNHDRILWKKKRDVAVGGTKILIASSTGGHAAITPMESLLAVALTLRGAEVHFLLCDKFLPACLQATSTLFQEGEFVSHGPSKSLCNGCFQSGRDSYEPLGLTLHRYSDFITREEMDVAAKLACLTPLGLISSYRMEGLSIGEHAIAGALRYFARGDFEGESQNEEVIRRYLEASLRTVFMAQRLFKKQGFQKTVFHHGIYVPQGLIGEVARSEGVAVVNWNPAYRKKCFIFSHENSYHHTLISEPTHRWEGIAWNPQTDTKLMDYLRSRWHGTQDWIWFHERPELELSKIAEEIGVDFSKPCIGMLTNVVWDAQLHFPANVFSNMMEWTIQTIRYFEKRTDLQLLIRVHPAEMRGTLPSRQTVVDEIRKIFPVLPKNVFVIPPESPVSTYATMLQCDSVIIYGTKMGVELAAVGMSVIVAGEAWVRNKGVTLDADSRDGYFRLLDQLPLGRRLDEATLRRARQYAFHFFFRRMIPLKNMEPRPIWPPFRVKIDSLQELMPNRDPGLDVICDGILEGKDFIYPAESLMDECRNEAG